MILGQLIYFWLASSPDPNTIGLEDWLVFRNEIAAWTVAIVAVFMLISLGVYSWSARKKLISVPADLFSPYTPLRWIFLGAISGLVMSIAYWRLYENRFPDTEVSWIGIGAEIGIWTAMLNMALTYLLICYFPGITPAKWRYRPMWFLYRSRTKVVS